jgi:protein TonB
MTVVQPEWSPERTIIESKKPDPPVVIEPTAARIAKRRFVQSAVGQLPVPDALAEPAVRIDPALRMRAEVNDARSWEHAAATPPPSPERRELKELRPTIARIEPPSSMGDAEDTPPDLSQNAPPNYPAIAIQRGWQGTVILRVSIDANGQVVKVEVARTSGFPVLDGAAATAVRRWRGRPAMQGGQASATVELLPVRFKL